MIQRNTRYSHTTNAGNGGIKTIDLFSPDDLTWTSRIDIVKSPKLFTSAKKRSFSLRTLKRYITFATVKHSIHPFKTERKGLIYVGTIISQPGLS